MDDATINRLVAERVYGWTFPHLRPNSQFCTDPAAWGALYLHLTERGCWVTLMVDPEGMRNHQRIRHYAGIYLPDNRMVDHGARDWEPGRALALAALRAYGVTIE